MERTKPTDATRGQSKSLDIVYNEESGTFKMLGPVLGDLRNQGFMSTVAASVPAVGCPIVAFYNTDTSTRFVQTGPTAASLSAVPTAATGICLPPNQYTLIALHAGDAFIKSSSALVVMYLVTDASNYR